MVNRQAAMVAYVDNYYLMMWLSSLVTPFALLMRKPEPTALVKGEAPH